MKNINDKKLTKNKELDINTINKELHNWQKEIVDNRINAITQNPERLKPIENLFQTMKNDI
jgi:ribosome-binding ATPase YchF (GTP1/OBG family)